MKIARVAVVVILGLFSPTTFGQPTHKEAKDLLMQASQKIKSYNTLYITFSYSFENNRVDPPVTQKESGNIALKGNNYHLNFMGMEQIRNGNKLYNILKADEEVQITEYNEEENTGLTPASILNFYQKGHSYKLGGTETINGKVVQYIILKPNASEDVDKIMVGIEKESKKLVSLKQWGTNGTVTTFKIESFEPDKDLGADYFVFNKKNYPGYYIVE